MVYFDDKTWAQLGSDVTAAATTLREALLHGREAYEAFIRYRNGRDDATLAAKLGVPVGQVADLAAAFQTMLELHNFATNVPAPVQGDRFFSMRKFT